MAEEMQYVAKLGIDDSSFLSSLTNMQGAFLKFCEGVGGGLLIVGTALAAATEKLIEMGKAAHEMEELSAVIGVSTGDLQKFAYAAQLAGESTTAYDGMLAKLTLSAGKAADASSAQAQAFARLGVNPSGKSTSEVFLEVARALQDIDDAQVKAEVSMTLLGRSWVEANKLSNHYIENIDKIENRTYVSAEQTKRLAEETAKLNKMWADADTNTKVFLANMLDINDAFMEFIHLRQKNEELSQGEKGFKNGMNLLDRAPSGIDATIASQQALFAQVSGENKKAAAQELSALNEEYNKGKMSLEEYNSKRAAIANGYVTGGAALLKGGPSGISSTGWDQGQTYGYFAEGVTGAMGVNASPTQANAYQLQIAAGLYQKYYDSLTGDKFGAQQYRSEIARQLAYNEAAAGYKSQEEAWAAVGYKQGTNITIQNYNMGNASPEEIANATAEKMSRLIAGGL